MKINEYQELALTTANKAMLGVKEEAILNGALGLNGEAGEVADIIKKNRFQGHILDLENVAKELGDCCWYIALLSHAIGYDLETIMQMNVDKLKKRFPEGFEAEKSINRE